MPVFFLLSGFCMTLGYGKKNYSGSTICKKQTGFNEEIFDSIAFYIGRFTRILPVYYFGLIEGAILIPLGHTPTYLPDNFWYNGVGNILSIFLVQTWALVFGFGANGPSWTVSTLFFFYLIYPR